MMFQVLLPDWFEAVQAESEEEAKHRAIGIIRSVLSQDDLICWEIGEDECQRSTSSTK